jgi:hypothetical protein
MLNYVTDGSRYNLRLRSWGPWSRCVAMPLMSVARSLSFMVLEERNVRFGGRRGLAARTRGAMV